MVFIKRFLILIVTFLFLGVTISSAQEITAAFGTTTVAVKKSPTTLPLPEQEIRSLFALSKQFQTKDLRKSDSINTKVLQLSLKNKFATGLGLYHLVCSENENSRGHFKEAVAEATEAAAVFKAQKERAFYLDAVYVSAFSMIITGDEKVSLAMVTAALRDATNLRFKKQIGQLYYFLAFYYFTVDEELDKAIRFNLNALNRFQAINDRMGILKVYYNLSTIYSSTGSFKEAESAAFTALHGLEKLENPPKNLVGALHNVLAGLYLEKRDYTTAQDYSTAALAAFKVNGNSYFMSLYLLTSIKIDIAFQRWDAVVSKADDVLELSQIKSNLIEANYFKGLAFYNKKEYLKSKLFLMQAFTLMDECAQRKNRGVYEALSMTYKRLNLFKEALRYHELFHHLEQEDFKKQKSNKISELQIQFETKARAIELKRENEELKKDIAFQKEKYVLLIAILFCFLLLFVYYFAYLKSKSKIKKIQEKNDTIKLKNSKIELLLREIHHRSKNNLQIIMSLLHIQAKEGKIKDIGAFLEISESRIQTMSLIHQNLYESKAVDRIAFQKYLMQLIAYLKMAMDLSDRIVFEVAAEKIHFEIETAIPLGLVVNELLTNTIKYAFPNQESGMVRISIEQVTENEFTLVYSDNGIGFDTSQDENQSFGMDLIKMLVKQLKGTVRKIPFEGTKYHITFNPISSIT